MIDRPGDDDLIDWGAPRSAYAKAMRSFYFWLAGVVLVCNVIPVAVVVTL